MVLSLSGVRMGGIVQRDPAMSDTFDRTKLSARENAILDGAIAGGTDMQIAQSLNITPSTVNSYWVRIRGKLGQLTRTELMALALKQERDTALAQRDELERESRREEQLNEDFQNAEIYRAALDAMPEAVLVCCERGIIRYVNRRLAEMFGYEIEEIVGAEVEKLVPERVQKHEGLKLAAYLKDPQPMRIGTDRVVYGRQRDDQEFRILLLLDFRETRAGVIATCLVRDFMHEISTRREFSSALTA